MSAMSSWDHHQVRVFQRYCSIYGVSLTPEVAVHLATRYARKHAGERPLAAHRAVPRSSSDAALSPTSRGNRQVRVFQRYCSIYGVSLTPEVAVHLATRYARKHAGERPLAEPRRTVERHPAPASRNIAKERGAGTRSVLSSPPTSRSTSR